jgi:hypothetical protein
MTMAAGMAERRDVPRETNPLVLFLAELAVALAERERDAQERRATMTVVDGKRGGKAA